MCTGIRLIAADGSVVYGRTMEFGYDTESEIIVIPRNYLLSGTAPENASGLSWNARYAVVGVAMLNVIGVVDGINEKGLAGGLFYFPHYAQYQTIPTNHNKNIIAPWQLLTWILTQWQTVAEVKQALPTIIVPNIILSAWGCVPPMHVIVHDTHGKSLVIEYVDGIVTMHDNPLGVITNAPIFDWHLTNIKNYIRLSPYNSSSLELNGVQFDALGQGSGMLGLPGDFTPPSRFIRAVAYSACVIDTKTAEQTRDTAFHILNLFNIPRGVIAEKTKDTVHYDYTQWTTVADLHNKEYYWHTYDNNELSKIDLLKTNLDASTHTIIKMEQPRMIRNCMPT